MSFDANGMKPTKEQREYRIAERVEAILVPTEGMVGFTFRMPLEVAPLHIAFSVDIIRQLAIQDLQFLRQLQPAAPTSPDNAPRILRQTQ